MIYTFLQTQMDYIFFFYGLGFILLAAVILSMSGSEDRPQWGWLGLFSLTHGASEWLDMLTLSVKDSPSFSVVRFIFMVVSFLFLVEFGRSGAGRPGGKAIGRWIFVPLLALAALGIFAGLPGLNASARYALGFTGALWAAAALWRYRKEVHPGSRSLLVAALGMGIYALATGAVVPEASFLPASLLNSASFFAETGFPIQLLRGVLACTMAAAFWQFSCASRRATFEDLRPQVTTRSEGWTIAMISAVLVAGWIMTYAFGEFGRYHDEQGYRSNLELARSMLEDTAQNVSELATTMAASPNLAAIGLPDKRDLSVMNSTLDRYARVIGRSICYVLDASGATLASSNRESPESFVGHSYAVRPYFKEAMAGMQGIYIAMGLTSKVPGFYAGSPIRDAGGTIVGVAVVKLNLDKSFMAPISGSYGFLVDANGMIISSTLPGYVMKTLRHLPEEMRHRLIATQAFPSLSNASALPAGYLPGRPITFQGQRLQGFEQTTSVMGLSFVLLGPMTSLALARLVAILITLLAAVLVVTFFVLQKKSSESLAHIASSERLHRSLVQGSPNWIGLFDQDGRCATINENGLAAMGRAGAEVQGRQFSEIWSEGTDPLLEDMVRRVFADERVSFEYEQTLPDGPSRTWQMILNPVREQVGRIHSFVGIAADITARKKAEQALRESEGHFRALVHTIPDLVWLKDKNGLFLTCNPPFEGLYGAREADIIGRTDYDFVDKELADLFLEHDRNAMAAGKPTSNEEWLTFADDGHCALHETIKTPMYDEKGTIIGVLGIARDLTERKRAEEEKDKMEAQIRQAKKLEAIGVLAGGIAHDFNNILSVILGFTELARGNDPSNKQLQEDLDEINTAANRARELIQQIQTFSRRDANASSLLHVPEIAGEALKLLRSTLPASIEMAMDIDETVGPVLAAPEDIRQIIMDLCTNAGQSMEDGGLLTVKVSETIPSDEFFSNHPDLARRTYVKIVIQDTGTGIPPQVLDSLFDPYFTTKSYGDGTGLGLAVTYGSIRKLGGDISVESELGRGSIFTVLLPVAPQGLKDNAGNPDSFDVPFLAGTERILLVDDQPRILASTMRILEQSGYTVTTARDGEAALELFKGNPLAFDLIISDISMPKLSGDKLAQEILNILPTMPILLAGGYSKKVTEESIREAGVRGLIKKPISEKNLLRSVRQVLDTD